MYAVLRETNYPTGEVVEDNSNFIKFQAKHAEQPGYAGTVVTHAGDGRYLTITLWDTREIWMQPARLWVQ